MTEPTRPVKDNPKPREPEPSSVAPGRFEPEQFSRIFLLSILIGFLVLFFFMIKIFLIPIVLAAVFCTLFYPVFKWLLRMVRRRRNLAAFLSCLILFLGLLIPVMILTNLVSHEAGLFYQSVSHRIQEVVESGDQGPLGKLKKNRWVKSFGLDKLNWRETSQDILKSSGAVIADFVRKTSGGAFVVVAKIFTTLFIMFYFFRDGEALLHRMKYLIPLSDKYREAVITRFVTVSRATIKGSVLIGLTQSTLGAITLWIFGVPSASLWFVVMLILSMIPLVGAWMVMHPAAIIQVMLGHTWQGIGIFLVTVLIISSIDNVMRPRLVGQFSGLHDLLIFFSAFGGILLFGAAGVLVGPIVAAVVVTILEIYSKEFKTQLDIWRPENYTSRP